jgi:dienelactone hydrolase
VIDDYGNNGPFDTTVVNNTGPDGGYTIFRPATLGQDGFKHSPVTWGNGILTTPSNYTAFLSTVASHGFVVIGSNDTMVRAQEMIDGLDWLVAQNAAPGDYQGNIDTERLVTLGYSWGGMGSVNAGSHAKVVATVSLHGLTGSSDALHGPLLLTT